eukprot:759048-Hanusia_phi.AAC.1
MKKRQQETSCKKVGNSYRQRQQKYQKKPMQEQTVQSCLRRDSPLHGHDASPRLEEEEQQQQRDSKKEEAGEPKGVLGLKDVLKKYGLEDYESKVREKLAMTAGLCALRIMELGVENVNDLQYLDEVS